MHIDQLAISTQPRNSWKAFDLGCRMAFRWWKPLYGFMLLATLPFFIVLNFISTEYGMFLLWLLKPWFERGLLYIYSREVFGQRVTISETLKAWPSQIKPLWLASITWLRLSPSRAFNLPVAQLEGLTGERRASRLRVLHQTNDNNTGWWTVICAHWEFFIILGLVAMINMLLPETVELNLFDEFGTLMTDYALWYNTLWYIAMVAVAPLYVGGSFAAYLNRRILLEGWDIELNFKKMKQAASDKKQGAVALLVLCFLGFTTPDTKALSLQEEQSAEVVEENDTPSEEEEETPARHTEINEALQDVFNSPPFSEKETYKDWRWTGWKWEVEEDKDKKDLDMSGWLAFFAMLAKFSEVILWVVFTLLLGAILWLSREHISRLLNYRLPKRDKVDLPSFSRSYKKSTLPRNISDELEKLLQESAYRQALSLLLVSSLIQLHQKYALPLKESMTESECLACITEEADSESSQFMSQLIDTWVKLAWAHQWPASEQMRHLVELWQGLFGKVAKGESI